MKTPELNPEAKLANDNQGDIELTGDVNKVIGTTDVPIDSADPKAVVLQPPVGSDKKNPDEDNPTDTEVPSDAQPMSSAPPASEQGQGDESGGESAPLARAPSSPSDWVILPTENGIVARNRHDNTTYEGSMEDFNLMLRG